MSIYDENPSSETPEASAESTVDTEATVNTKSNTPSEELPEEAENDAPASPGKDPLTAPRIAFEYLETFAAALCVVLLIFMFALRFCSVKGPSMENTLVNGEKLFVSNLFYTPERGDIIIFHQTGQLNEPIVKRVIATEGEWVKVEYGRNPNRITVTVRHTDTEGNLVETVLDESSYAYIDNGNLRDTWNHKTDSDGFTKVPDGHVFVMGDNRNNSLDSRDAAIGFVDERRILGRVLFRSYPFSKFGAVD